MILIGFSGKKQSGKDSACRFLVDYFRQQPTDYTPKIRTFYVGGPMKEFAKTFGVPHDQVWGDDQAKNQLTEIRWENLPHYHRLCAVARRHNQELMDLRNRDQISQVTLEQRWQHPKTGQLTAREFLQQIGEEMFLGMDPLYWVRQFKASVRASDADVGLVADPRKPEQIHAIHELGGIVIRLMRDPYNGADQHISEVALDPDRFNWEQFDEVVDNRDLTVDQTNEEVIKRLRVRGVVK